MRTPRFLLLAVLIVTSACGAPAPGSTTANTLDVGQGAEAGDGRAEGPEEVLVGLFHALRVGDYEGTSELVDEAQLGLLAAIEVGDASALFAFEEGGLTVPARKNFWSAFAGSMPGLLQVSSEDISASIKRQFAIDGVRFAIGQVIFDRESVSGDFVLRLADDQWRLDPVATFGGAFVAPIRNWLRTIPPDQVAPVSDLLRRDEASWRALADLQTDEDEAGIAISREVADLLIEVGLTGDGS